MRVTVIAFFFPPVNQVGYKRPLRLVDYLRKQGHEVTVYAVSPDTPQLWNYSGVDADLEKLIPAGVRVIRSPSIHGVKSLIGFRDRLKGRNQDRKHGVVKVQTSSASATKDQGSAPAQAPTVPKTPGLLQRIVDGVQKWCETPDPYVGWVLTTLPGMLFRGLFRRPDLIYVTAPPWSPLLVATLAGKILRVPVHADFRDPWTINKYWKAQKVAIALERWVINQSATVIANTRSMGNAFLESHPGLKNKLSVIYNGYETETANLMGDLRAKHAVNKRREFFTVTHIGMLYPNRMPRALAACLAEVASQWRHPRPLRIRFVGNVMDPAPLLEEFGRLGVADVLEFTGEVKTSQARIEEVLADVLLLLQSGTREQIPAKVFEYAFAGNPILCVADPGSETASLVADFALGEVLHGHENASEWLKRLENMYQESEGARPVPEKFLQEFDGERLSARIFAAMVKP